MVLALDLFLVVCFFLTLIDGVRNGFFRESFTLAGLGVGLWGAIRYTGLLQERLPSLLRFSQAAGVVIFVLICAAIVIALRLTGCAFSAMWEGKKPSSPSRIAGLILGSFRGLILVLVLATGLALLFPAGSPFLGGSRLLPYLSPGIVWGTELLPKELGDRILWKWGQLPFEDRAMRRARSVRGSWFDGSADRRRQGKSSDQKNETGGGIVALWPFAS